jgi:hypothetical protein
VPREMTQLDLGIVGDEEGRFVDMQALMWDN